ncbi:hypothetical protein AND_006473 [Anopheles darlingi]|uniref:Uncharacterized protein n=1 Tax=Anopheles darlingi TaxID=43151 RepID=W5JEU3_ANODA|nr:hypothetical protein AND_006473 [Anopheles darlingi]
MERKVAEGKVAECDVRRVAKVKQVSSGGGSYSLVTLIDVDYAEFAIPIKPLFSAYQKDLSNTLWEPLNTFWAECYESCKLSSQRRAKLQMESRRKFQERILVPCRIRQSEENARLNVQQAQRKAKDANTERRWLTLQRFLYGPKGAWTRQ